MKNENKLNIEVAIHHRLPKPIYLQSVTSEEEYKRWIAKRDRDALETPTLGRPKKEHTYKKPVLIFGRTSDELDIKIELLSQIIGPKSVGNKRHALTQLYVELLDIFIVLRNRRIRLPKGGSLSIQAVQFGLGDFLNKYSYTSHTAEHLAKDSVERLRVGKVMKNIFRRVGDVLDTHQSVFGMGVK